MSDYLVELILFVLPAYLANSIPVVLGGGTSMDLGQKFVDGRRWFGKGKTIRGFVAGMVGGTLLGVVYSVGEVGLFGISAEEKIVLAFLLSLGALSGDVLGSFVKRRLKINEGEPFFVIDQLLFLVAALFLAFAYRPATALSIGFLGTALLIVVTFVSHLLFNLLAHRLKLKKVPW